MTKRIISIFVGLCFILTNLSFSQAQAGGDFVLPQVGKMVGLSPSFFPAILKGLKVHAENPFFFDFILDQGDSPSLIQRGGDGELKQEATKLIKYFLASLTIPEKDLWVNLSPYENDRIIPRSFGLTQMGRDLLAEDYMLKQITASLIYPEGETGKKFWERVYQEAFKRFGTTQVAVNTFNKVWILPDKALVYENVKAQTAYVVEAKLKVMLEQDYVALSHHVIPAPDKNIRGSTPAGIHNNINSESGFPIKTFGNDKEAGIKGSSKDISALGSQIIREIVIPQLTKEINEGKNFAPLRQVYNSLILAVWYKKKIKDSILSQVYADKNKVAGVGYDRSIIPQKINEKTKDAEAIYQRYLSAFKKGVYNYIKEEQDTLTQQIVPRKYFSGGLVMEVNPAMTTDRSILRAAWHSLKRGLSKVAAVVTILGTLCGAGGCKFDVSGLPKPDRQEGSDVGLPPFPDVGHGSDGIRPSTDAKLLPPLREFPELNDPKEHIVPFWGHQERYYSDPTRGYLRMPNGFMSDLPMPKIVGDSLLSQANLLLLNPDTRVQGQMLRDEVFRHLYGTSAEAMALVAMTGPMLGEIGARIILNTFGMYISNPTGNRDYPVTMDGKGRIFDIIQISGFGNADVGKFFVSKRKVSMRSTAAVGLSAIRNYAATKSKYPQLLDLAKKLADVVLSRDDWQDTEFLKTAGPMAALRFLKNLANVLDKTDPDKERYQSAAKDIYVWLRDSMFSKDRHRFFSAIRFNKKSKSWEKVSLDEYWDPETAWMCPDLEILEDGLFGGRTVLYKIMLEVLTLKEKPDSWEGGISFTPQLAVYKIEVNGVTVKVPILAVSWTFLFAARAWGLAEEFRLDLGPDDPTYKTIRKQYDSIVPSFAASVFKDDGTGGLVAPGAFKLSDHPELVPQGPAPYTDGGSALFWAGPADLMSAITSYAAESKQDPYSLNKAMATRGSERTDKATVSTAAHHHTVAITPGEAKRGGIDLTSGNMNVQTKTNGNSGPTSSGIAFHLDPAMLQQLQKVPGFEAVVINIQPLKSLPEFLGFD